MHARNVPTATISPMGESPCSSAVSIQSSSFRIDLLLHFADKVLGVLEEKLGPGAVAANLDATVVVCERHAAIGSPLGAEGATQRVNFEVRVGLEDADALAEVLEGNVVQPGRESAHAAADAHVLAGVSAALQIDALADLQFNLVVNGFKHLCSYCFDPSGGMIRGVGNLTNRRVSNHPLEETCV